MANESLTTLTGGQFIPLQEAVNMTSLYRKEQENILDPAYRNMQILPLSETFQSGLFVELMAQPGCAGFRFYYGMDDKNLVHLVVVGVDANNEDILSNTNPLVIEWGSRCPFNCPPPSVLNS